MRQWFTSGGLIQHRSRAKYSTSMSSAPYVKENVGVNVNLKCQFKNVNLKMSI